MGKDNVGSCVSCVEEVGLEIDVLSETLIDVIVSLEEALGTEEDAGTLCSLLELDEALGLEDINEQPVKVNNAVR